MPRPNEEAVEINRWSKSAGQPSYFNEEPQAGFGKAAMFHDRIESSSVLQVRAWNSVQAFSKVHENGSMKHVPLVRLLEVSYKVIALRIGKGGLLVYTYADPLINRFTASSYFSRVFSTASCEIVHPSPSFPLGPLSNPFLKPALVNQFLKYCLSKLCGSPSLVLR